MKTYSRDEVYEATLKYFKGDTLATDVWINKYSLKDASDDDVDENTLYFELTPDDMHRRLAKELHRIESKYKNPLTENEIFELIKNFKYIVPQGSPMSGIGNDKQVVSLSNCVHGESLVYTKEFGLIKMRDVKEGMSVLTHKNRFRKVVKHWSNGLKETYTLCRTFGNKRPSVSNENEMGRFLAATPEHKVYTSDDKWVEISEIINKQNKSLKQPILETEIKSPDIFPIGGGKHIFVDKNFCWFVGLYLAEGAIHKKESKHPSLYLTLNSEEEFYVKNRLDEYFVSILGHGTWIQKWNDLNFIQMNIHEPEFAYLMMNLFGYGFKDKRLPEWVFSLEPELIKELIDGFLFGDGTNYESFDDNYNFFAIANPTLAYELGMLCRKLDKNVRFNFLVKGKLVKNRTIAVTISTNKDKVIAHKSPQLVEVFDMEVEDDHSFVAGDIICHNCFVVGNTADSYGGIFMTDQEQAQLMKRRGGVGHDLSHLRPKGMKVKNSALTSTGIVPFMERFSNTTKEVAQDGRRGALMLTVSIKHPDSESFIDAKLEKGKIEGANISVKIDDEFMNAAMNDEPYIQQFPIKSSEPKFKKGVDASKLWKKIIHNAWKSAEPGVLFWDTVMRESVPDCYSDHGFTTISTNPCGEITLCPYDSCRLLAVNLYSYVNNPFSKEAYFDFDLFADHIQKAQRFMDDIIDLEIEKIFKIQEKIKTDPEDETIKVIETKLWEKILDMSYKGRRTGLGVTAEGDMLAALGLTYGTSEATDFSTKVHKTLAINAYKSSAIMAKERGSFPVYEYDRELNNPFIQRLKNEDSELADLLMKYGRRNISLLTVAPTGSVSILTQTTSGIEPVYLVSYKRRRKINPNDKNSRSDYIDEQGIHWEEYNVFHHKFEVWLNANGYDVENVKMMKDDELKEIVKLSPYYKATSSDVDWLEKVRMQGNIQKFVDHSISVTVNLPKDVTEEVVSKVYETGWHSGCKGITVYREGSRQGVIVSNDDKTIKLKENNAPKRPTRLECEVIRFMNKGEKWIGFLGFYPEKDGNQRYPYEIFTGLADSFQIPLYVEKGEIIKVKIEEGNEVVKRYDFEYVDKDGYKVLMQGLSRAFNREFWNTGKLVSALLRHAIHLPSVLNIIDSLDMAEGSMAFGTWKAGVKRIIKKHLKDSTGISGEFCPECGSTNIIWQNGCKECQDCGFQGCD